MRRALHGDDYSCPWCGHKMDEEFAEANIGKSLWCEACKYPVVAVITKSTYLTLNKRMKAMKMINRREAFKKDLPFIMSVAKKYIQEENGKVTNELLERFFKNGKYKWVMRARRKFVFEMYVLGYSKAQIRQLFQMNGGNLKKTTLKGYLYLESIDQ